MLDVLPFAPDTCIWSFTVGYRKPEKKFTLSCTAFGLIPSEILVIFVRVVLTGFRYYILFTNSSGISQPNKKPLRIVSVRAQIIRLEEQD